MSDIQNVRYSKCQIDKRVRKVGMSKGQDLKRLDFNWSEFTECQKFNSMIIYF